MHKKYVAKLKPEERTELLELTQNGKAAAKTLTHARILLKADATSGQPGWTDQAISDALDVSVATIGRVRRIYVQQGWPPHSNANLEPSIAHDDSMVAKKPI